MTTAEATRRYDLTLAAAIRFAEATVAAKKISPERRAQAQARLAELVTIRDARPVYLIHEGGDTPKWMLCETCVDATDDPEATRADIVRRHDAGHCVGCDFHAEDFRTNCMDCLELGRSVD